MPFSPLFGAGGGGSFGAYSCPAGVSVGDVVYVSAPDAVDQADAAAWATMPAVGFVVAKPGPLSAIVAYGGEVAVAGPLVAGVPYYVAAGAPGAIVAARPVGAGEVAQLVGVGKDGTTLAVEIDPSTIEQT